MNVSAPKQDNRNLDKEDVCCIVCNEQPKESKRIFVETLDKYICEYCIAISVDQIKQINVRFPDEFPHIKFNNLTQWNLDHVLGFKYESEFYTKKQFRKIRFDGVQALLRFDNYRNSDEAEKILRKSWDTKEPFGLVLWEFNQTASTIDKESVFYSPDETGVNIDLEGDYFEQVIKKAAGSIPLIALSNPLFPQGSSKKCIPKLSFNLESDLWLEKVYQLVEASTVVFYIIRHGTQGIVAELEAIKSTDSFHKTIVINFGEKNVFEHGENNNLFKFKRLLKHYILAKNTNSIALEKDLNHSLNDIYRNKPTRHFSKSFSINEGSISHYLAACRACREQMSIALSALNNNKIDIAENALFNAFGCSFEYKIERVYLDSLLGLAVSLMIRKEFEVAGIFLDYCSKHAEGLKDNTLWKWSESLKIISMLLLKNKTKNLLISKIFADIKRIDLHSNKSLGFLLAKTLYLLRIPAQNNNELIQNYQNGFVINGSLLDCESFKPDSYYFCTFFEVLNSLIDKILRKSFFRKFIL